MQNIFKPLALPNAASLALLFLRIVVGLAFMLHGWGKIQHPLSWMGPEAIVPPFFQAAAALSEFVGGFLLIVGLFTPIAALGIACTMAFATWTHAVLLHDPFVSKGGGGSYELALVFLGVALMLMLAGPGRFSIDNAVFGER